MDKIHFPKDEQKHNFLVEWWYFNGILTDKQGNTYAFMECLFKVNPQILKTFRKIFKKDFYFSHSVFSDIPRKRFTSEISPITLLSEKSFKKPLLFLEYLKPSLKGFTKITIQEHRPFSYTLSSRRFHLQLHSQQQPLLEAGTGYVNLNTKNTYYYSLTNLKAQGKLFLNNKKIPVTGKVWMDHQWSNSAESLDQWIWFSLQLDNNTEIVCFEFNDHKKKTFLASMIDPSNTSSHTDTLSFTPLGKPWKSKTTGTSYPLSWKIKIPAFNAQLEAKPLLTNQELLFANINYWEGPLSITGTISGKKVKGQGFLELVGFPRQRSLLQAYLSKLKEATLEKIQ